MDDVADAVRDDGNDVEADSGGANTELVGENDAPTDAKSVWKGPDHLRHVLTTADRRKGGSKLAPERINRHKRRPVTASGRRAVRKKGQHRIKPAAKGEKRTKWRRRLLYASQWWRQRVKDGGCGRPRHSFADENGRECTECGWYKPWVDKETGKENFHRSSSGIGGRQQRCKDCRNRELKKRRDGKMEEARENG